MPHNCHICGALDAHHDYRPLTANFKCRYCHADHNTTPVLAMATDLRRLTFPWGRVESDERGTG